MSDVLEGTAVLIGDVAAPYALITMAGRSIGGIIPNVTFQEVIVDENTITQHPVQSGAPISDHVFANPTVTDMLVGWSDCTGQYDGYIEDVYQTILALRDTRQPFDLYTGKRMISNVLFGNITSTTDDTSDSTLMLRVRLQEVIIATTATASAGSSSSSSSSADSSNSATKDNQADPKQTAPESNVGSPKLQADGTESETAASARAATIAGWQTPVTTPLPTTSGGGIGGLPVSSPPSGIGSA